MLLTGHKSRAIFDRYNIINEQELLDAGDQLVAYLAQAVPARRRPHPVGPAAPHTAPALPPRATHHRVRARGPPPPARNCLAGTLAVAGHRPSVRRGSHPGPRKGRPTIVAHAATGRADAAEHEHALGPTELPGQEDGRHPPT